MKDLITEWAEENGIDITDENIDQITRDFAEARACRDEYLNELY